MNVLHSGYLIYIWRYKELEKRQPGDPITSLPRTKMPPLTS